MIDNIMMDEVQKTILVVEDEPEIRNSLKEFLELEGYSVSIASNGNEALKLLGYIKKPAVILMDLMMPEMNGWELSDQLAKIECLSDIPIIALTAFPRSARTVRCNQIFRKPFDAELLLPAIEQLAKKTP